MEARCGGGGQFFLPCCGMELRRWRSFHGYSRTATLGGPLGVPGGPGSQRPGIVARYRAGLRQEQGTRFSSGVARRCLCRSGEGGAAAVPVRLVFPPPLPPLLSAFRSASNFGPRPSPSGTPLLRVKTSSCVPAWIGTQRNHGCWAVARELLGKPLRFEGFVHRGRLGRAQHGQRAPVVHGHHALQRSPGEPEGLGGSGA